FLDPGQHRRLEESAAVDDAPRRRGDPRSCRRRCQSVERARRGDPFLPSLVTDKVPRGVVASEKGAWLSTSRTGQTISALDSADSRSDIALGACFNDTRVEVAAA